MGDFQAAGVSPAAIDPATLGDADGDGLPELTLPIKTDLSEAVIRHAGGLNLRQASSGMELPLRNPAVELKMPSPILTVRIREGNVPVADLDVSAMTKTLRADGADIAGVVAKLNSQAAGILNSAFQTNVFAAGDAIGRGRSSVTLK